jgi:hypothetical protein
MEQDKPIQTAPDRFPGIQALVGKLLVAVTVNDDKTEILFETSYGEFYRMFHGQDCCEYVRIEDINGDLNDLIGDTILEAYESSNSDDPIPEGVDSDASHTWTFYRLRTMKTTVVIRWLGTSNGYYSEDVDFKRMN